MITLYEKGYPFNNLKIAERIVILKNTCFSILKCDKQYREASANTSYTKNAASSGHLLKFSSRERRFLIRIVCRCRRTILNQLMKILLKSITTNTARFYLTQAGIDRRTAGRKSSSFVRKIDMYSRLG